MNGCFLEDTDPDSRWYFVLYSEVATLLNEVYRIPLHEAKAREKIIRRIIRAKREAGYPLKCDFFADVWPAALAALIEKREREAVNRA
jgi:hypothetical protein